MPDALRMAAIVASFAALCTVHVALAASLSIRGPWWRGLVAFAVAPLAPYWGFRDGLRRRAVAWTTALVLYVAARVLASG
jgi:hypothetical protein